jgi:hypothetical protein
MKRFLAIFALPALALPAGVLEAAPYEWSISASNVDPFVNTETTPGLHTVYLWLVCSDLPAGYQDGISAALFAIVTSPPGVNLHVATMPVNGFLNAGSVTNLLLAVSGCPAGPVVAANLLIIVNAPGNMCLAPSQDGTKGTVDCSQNPQLWPIDWVGLSILGGSPCSKQGVPGSCPCGVLPTHFTGLFCFESLCVDVCTACDYEDCAPYAVDTCDECGPTSLEPGSWGRTKSLYR